MNYKMKTLNEYIKESLLDDFDDQPEISDLLFSYIFDIKDINMYEQSIDYLKSNSKLIDNKNIHKVKSGSVCFIITNDPKKPKQSTVIIAGVMSDDKCMIIYYDPNKEQVIYNKLYADINTFCIDDAFNICPIYELKSKKLSDGFKKIKY